MIMTSDDDPELDRLIVTAREALDRLHRLTGFPADVVVAAAEALSREAAAAVDAYRDRKRREAGRSSRA